MMKGGQRDTNEKLEWKIIQGAEVFNIAIPKSNLLKSLIVKSTSILKSS